MLLLQLCVWLAALRLKRGLADAHGSGRSEFCAEVSFRSVVDAMRVFDAIFENARDTREVRSSRTQPGMAAVSAAVKRNDVAGAVKSHTRSVYGIQWASISG